MKKRKFFVSNSSSSSFICEVCGESYTGYDACASDCEMTYCVNGHLLCDEHILANDSEVEEKDDDGELLPEFCPICQFKLYSETEMEKYLVKTRGIEPSVVFEEIKKMNKRRKKLYPAEYIKYCFDKFELNEDMMLEELRSKFKNFNEYRDFLYN